MRAWARAVRQVWGETLAADRRTALLVAVLTFAQAAVVAATGLGQRWLVDSAVVADAAGLVLAVAVGAAAHGLAAAGGRVRVNAQLYLIGRTTAALQRDLLAGSAAIPTTHHLEQPEYLDRMGRVQRGFPLLGALPWTVAGASGTSASLLASVLLLVSVHPALALLAVLSAVPLLANRRAATILQEARDACARLYRHEQRFHELCTDPVPAKEIVVAGAGLELIRRADEAWRTAMAREGRAHVRAAVWQCAAWLVYLAGAAAALLVVERLVRQGQASLGDGVLVFTLATHLLAQITQAADDYERVAEGGQVVRHHHWLAEYARSQTRGGGPPPPRLSGGIVLDGVSFRYPGGTGDVLHGVDLHLRAGTTVALVGENGAGKTTLVRLLTGLYEPTAGRILVDGRPLADLDRAAWQARLTCVFQDFARFHFRAGEVIGVGDLDRLGDPGALRRVAARSGAQSVLEQLPHGPRTQLGAAFGGIEPSLGQWQRLALARGLMRPDPLLSVLDEPTAALDPDAEYQLFRTFVEQARATGRRGAVTLVVSHRLATARLADLIVVLHEGRVTEIGRHADLMAAGASYAELFNLQERAYRSPR